MSSDAVGVFIGQSHSSSLYSHIFCDIRAAFLVLLAPVSMSIRSGLRELEALRAFSSSEREINCWVNVDSNALFSSSRLVISQFDHSLLSKDSD